MQDVAVLILYNKQGQIFLQHRTAYKKRWANYWGTFGGSIEEGETVDQALEREVLEVLGYRVRTPHLLFVQDLGTDKKYVHVEAYDESQVLTPDRAECQDARWVTVEEALTLELIPHEVEVVEKVGEYLRGLKGGA